jgi:excinuclease ABC subunit C
MHVIAEALALKSSHAVSVSVPQRGDKKHLIEQVVANAKNALALHIAEKMQASASLEGVQKLFALPEVPKRIEVYDNSHISGTNAVGAMIVATPDGFDKKSYRKFSFTPDVIAGGDDYAMMREVMMRRLSRLQKEDPDRTSTNVPDLLLIDGGKGQLSVVREVMEELGINDIPYVAISKGPDRNAGREQFHVPDKTPFQLPPDDSTLYYLQRLRDEAHRFAIASHRGKRAAAIRKSTLDEVPGIGAARKKALLHHFGSADAVKGATIDDLMKVEGVSRKGAHIIHDYFRE